MLQVDVEALMSTAVVLSRSADDLEAGLARIVTEWAALRKGWSGLAASNYELSWEDWHHGARTVTAMLSEMSLNPASASSQGSSSGCPVHAPRVRWRRRRRARNISSPCPRRVGRAVRRVSEVLQRDSCFLPIQSRHSLGRAGLSTPPTLLLTAPPAGADVPLRRIRRPCVGRSH